jgi:site-specific DNA-methyltransferase (adenine-specific)
MKKDNTQTLNMDCMEYLKDVPDKYFELAIVDPPYGIGEDGAKNHSRGRLAKPKLYTAKNWDNSAPNAQYFDILKSKSKNQIIWGANHFIDNLPFNLNSSCWLVWDKVNGDNDFADCELAWTSHKTAVRKFTFKWAGMFQEDMKNKEVRIHPTQKPVKLYEWLLMNYAKEGDKILDTHLGSGSSRIAAYNLGFEFVGIELDQEYFEAQEKRFNQHISQLTLF